MDDDLRNGLWNCLCEYYLFRVRTKVLYLEDRRGIKHRTNEFLTLTSNISASQLIKGIWIKHFKQPIDALPRDWDEVYSIVRTRFFKSNPKEVYKFVEFVANNYPNNETNSRFMEACNQTLERELSGYRFVDGHITEIRSKEEINEIQEALGAPLKPVTEHLKQSLKHLSHRPNPDYRNSIKESVSAVESLCKLITKKDKLSLGKALDEIVRMGIIEIEPALKRSLDALYGYASNVARHGSIKESEVSFDEAKLLLVFSSAFVNYLIAKVIKAGVDLSTRG